MHPHRAPRLLALALVVLLAPPAAVRRDPAPPVVIGGWVRDSMNAIWTRGNEHWNELADENTLTQMLGTGKPTQREFLGCLGGYIARDTVWITRTALAHDMRQLQFAVTGTCDPSDDRLGTWHTHPYRADSLGAALKERGLSAQDLATFRAGDDRVVLVVWDIDSLDAAVRTADGSIVHPAPVVVR